MAKQIKTAENWMHYISNKPYFFTDIANLVKNFKKMFVYGYHSVWYNNKCKFECTTFPNASWVCTQLSGIYIQSNWHKTVGKPKQLQIFWLVSLCVCECVCGKWEITSELYTVYSAWELFNANILIFLYHFSFNKYSSIKDSYSNKVIIETIRYAIYEYTDISMAMRCINMSKQQQQSDNNVFVFSFSFLLFTQFIFRVASVCNKTL